MSHPMPHDDDDPFSEAAQIATIESMIIGCTFRADRQIIHVNHRAVTAINNLKWIRDGRVFCMTIKSKWRAGRLTEGGPISLVDDSDVGDDGYGTITVYRNIQIVDNSTPMHLKVEGVPLSWITW